MTPRMISAAETFMILFMRGERPDVRVIMSGQDVPAKTSFYVRFWVIPSDQVLPVGIGETAKSRNVGVIQADVYGPKGHGAGQTADLAFAIAKAFNREPIATADGNWIICKDAGVKDMGVVGEEYRQMVRVPYRYDFPAITY